MKIFGTTTIHPILFYIGKLSFVGNMIFFFLKDYVKAYEFNSTILLAAFLLILIPGILIFIISLVNLGNSLRVGLPEEETKLKTDGLYAFSRNPIYISVFMFSIASCIFVPHWLNIVFLAATTFVHHLIIRGEEKFLLSKFNIQWVEYCEKVRRYL